MNEYRCCFISEISLICKMNGVAGVTGRNASIDQSINQSINARFVGRRYTTRPGAPAIASCKHYILGAQLYIEGVKRFNPSRSTLRPEHFVVRLKVIPHTHTRMIYRDRLIASAAAEWREASGRWHVADRANMSASDDGMVHARERELRPQLALGTCESLFCVRIESRIESAVYTSEYLINSIGIYYVFVTNESDARN